MLLDAHIFKRRSRGDREEVKIKLFNPDGSDYEGSAPGGGASGERTFFIGHSFVPSVPDSESVRIAFGNSNPSYVEGFEFPPGTLGDEGVLQLPVPKGPYLVRVDPSWGFITPPASGYTQVNLQLVDSEGFDNSSWAYVFEQFGMDPPQYTPPGMTLMYVPQDGMHFEIELNQGGTEQTPDLTLRVEIFQL